MLLDNVTLSVIVGFILIFIYFATIRKFPDTSKVIYLFIFAQSLTYGGFLILYGITEDIDYLIDKRWTISLGGLALLWVGLEGFIGKLQEDRRKQNIDYDNNIIKSQKQNDEEQNIDVS